MAYTKGDSPHFHTEFRHPHTDALVDPTTVVFRYETPAGVETTLTYGSSPTLTRDSAGKYLAQVTLDEAGTWQFRWETTGTYRAVAEFSRYVAASELS